MGRRRKPTALHVVEGTFNATRHKDRDKEPQPSGKVKKPPFVKGRSAKLWKQYAPDLEAKGVLTAWDVDMFGAWCCLMAELQIEPRLFTAAKLSQLRALASEFGLTPPARARLKTGADEKEKDPAEAFFA